MENFIRILTNTWRLKRAVKELSLEQLKDIDDRLSKIIQEEKEKDRERLRKIVKYKKLMADDGIDIVDLYKMLSKKKTRTQKRPEKYEIYIGDKRITWTGRGRMPDAFKYKIAAGEDLEKYLIKVN